MVADEEILKTLRESCRDHAVVEDLLELFFALSGIPDFCPVDAHEVRISDESAGTPAVAVRKAALQLGEELANTLRRCSNSLLDSRLERILPC